VVRKIRNRGLEQEKVNIVTYMLVFKLSSFIASSTVTTTCDNDKLVDLTKYIYGLEGKKMKEMS
jgi:hypothetical protein